VTTALQYIGPSNPFSFRRFRTYFYLFIIEVFLYSLNRMALCTTFDDEFQHTSDINNALGCAVYIS